MALAISLALVAALLTLVAFIPPPMASAEEVHATPVPVTDDEEWPLPLTEDGTRYGRDLKARMFYLSPTYVNLNHGSYGTVPRPVKAVQDDLFLLQESRPDAWFRKEYYRRLDDARGRIASYVGASEDDVVLVENASSAVNSVLRSMPFERGDAVVRLSTAYGMVVETLDYLRGTAGIEVIVAEVTYPVEGPDQMVRALEEALRRRPDVKLCVFSHISSMPAIVEPLDRLVASVRSIAPSATVLVDGAHAPGQLIGLDVPSLGVDFYLGNCHKWMYAPKGTAFLWSSPSRRTSTFPEPTVISSSGRRDYEGRYAYTGTRDYTAFASLGSALDFRSYLGGEGQIGDYCRGLAFAAGRFLALAWGTDLLVPEGMSGYMINVILPPTNEDAVRHMQKELDEVHDVYLVCGAVLDSRWEEFGNDADDIPRNVAATQRRGEREAPNSAEPTKIFFVRLSAQVYLEMEDFRPLAKLVPELLQKAEVDLLE
uniref:Aminotransferase class V domain-containing protein n=1 Tax=Trieres chinensis TaxID=1514140 RepID=A0A7S1YTA7_TRICV|mmetsp:Transcript_10232/g.21543  ORF Transcript_10232/g.21543 Transcript_10232/m.21543 type:complete len:484 (+) Transcript_10232:55-1506(+)